MPGAGWKRKGEAYRANMDRTSDVPHQYAKEQMVRATRCAIQLPHQSTLTPHRDAGGRKRPAELHVDDARDEPVARRRVPDQDVGGVDLHRGCGHGTHA